MAPEISIIMPAYNTGKYISEAIESVIDQTFQDWELIIINDGSPDDALEIAKRYAARDPRIKVISQLNSGVITARNNGIKASRGKYIFPLDSDDKIARRCLERLYEIITSCDYAVVCPGGRFFGEKSGSFDFPAPTRKNMYGGRNGIHNSSIYERKYWEKYGGYDVAFNKGFEDFDFWLNFLDDGKKAIRIPDELFFYRIKPRDESRNTQCIESANKPLWAALHRKHWRMRLYKILRKLKVLKK
ncbi:MAG: glycosyltransferase family 2 protein [Alphaproteobacteria bacterium]|nr:glycosyltransferase family 2 protein [Alphaproteobacteria bacterium]